MIATPDSLKLALQHQREGRANEAEQVYRQILEQQPDSVDALNLLGALAYQQGRFQEAVACFEKVLTLQPDNPDSYNSIGVVLKGQGRAEEAVSYYRRALELRPDHPEVHNNLGNVLRQTGEIEAAIAAYQQAIALKPNYPEAHNNLGVALKDRGQFEEAIPHYQQAIALRPHYAEAYQNLGVAFQRSGRLEEATQAYQQAINLRPNYPEVYNSLGNLLQQQGRFEEAVVQHQQAIALKPNYPEAHHSLANAFQQQKKLEEAIAEYRQALTLRPDYPEACSNLGNALQEQGRLEEAIAQYRRALELRPNFAEAHSNLGAALKEQHKLEEAIAHFQEAIALRPDYAEVYNNLGNVYQEQNRVEEAIACYRKALEIKPDFAEIHSNLGNILQQEGQFKEAFDHFQRAIAIQPNYAGAYNNLGIALRNQGRIQEASEAYEQAIAIDPNFVEAHWNKALNQLLVGNFREGFAGYEWRFQWSRFQKQTPPRSYPQPRWDGSPFEGKTLLLYAEQGMGDTIQFIRFASLAAERGGRVIVECHPPLVELLRVVPGIAQIIPYGSPLPPFDVHAPLLSLPYILGTTLDTLPANVPYLPLTPPPTPPSPYHSSTSLLLFPPPASLKIGLVWSGNPENPYNRARTFPLERLLTLTDIPGVWFCSLQKEPPASDRPLLQAHPEVQDLREHLTSFIATATFINQLDLVISVDTAVTHLTGAMGKPVWLLLPYAADWRWMLDREDSPWYPTMRIFRQPSFGDWESVLEQVRQALVEQIGGIEAGIQEHVVAPASNLHSPLTPHSPIPPSPIPEELKIAIRHQQAGRLREAEQVCHQILQQQDHPEVWHLLGLIAHRERRYDEAIAYYRQVLTREPNHQDVCNNLAVALHEQGKLDEAIAQYQQALRLKPDYPDAHNNYANALRAKGLVEEAIHHYRMAIAYNPGYADAYNNLGLALYAQGEFSQAADCYRQAVTLRPNYPQAHNHLGNALKELGDFKQAVEHYRQAIALKPDYAKAYNNWGNIFRDEGDLATAIQYYDQAIAIEPEFAEAHWNKALTLLIGGNLQQGFAEYEWRWRVKLPSFHPMRSFPAPLWDGSPLQGKTIFLHAEQGMGDIIQFVRYTALVAERGGKILLECHPPLVNLLKRIPHIQQVIPYGSSTPPFDVHAPLMSLAYILDTTLETIPATVPYLTAPSEPALPLSRQDRDRALPPPSLKVGLVWSGNPENPYNRFRTIPLTHLLPLAEIPGIHLYNLQKDPSPADLELLAAHPEIWDLREQLTDFVHTAALINQLDLVISVDTAITHLAGALGKPVWLLLPYAPDWRWMLKRQDSPWYPTLRLFRQPSQGDWASVMEQVKGALLTQLGAEKPGPISFSQPVESGIPRSVTAEPTGFRKSQKQETRGKKKRERKDVPSPAVPYPLLETAFQQYTCNQLLEAERTCRQILEQHPAQVETLHLLGVILCRNGQTEAAIAQFQQVLQQQPDFADAWCNLGSALREQGQAEEAIVHYRRAIALNPNHADAHYNLGIALQDQDDLEEALTHCQQAAVLKPDFVDAHYSLGFVLRRLGRLEEAIASYRRAIQLAPNYPEAHKNLGHALLLKGDLATGFAEYEWRWQQKNWCPRPFSQPVWDGSSLSGKTILLHAEQGIGDTLQFIRYVPLVKRYGGKVIVECQPSLLRLLKTVADIDDLIPQGSPLPPFDVHAPLLSLPHILGTTLDTIPASVPYLHPPLSPSPLTPSFKSNNQPLTTDLHPILPSLIPPSPHPPSPLKIGLVWAGNPAHKNDRHRSCKLELFQPLLDLPGICFYSLQKGEAAADLRRFQFPIHDLSTGLDDFADTAMAIAQLDLVISVDTAVAHLAGALGKPVWLLLSYSPDWRWMLNRQDSPWYPTLRLFRQKHPGDWQSVFEQLREALQEWKEANTASGLEPQISSPGKTQITIAWQPELISSTGVYGLYLTLQLLKHPTYEPIISEATDIQSLTPLYRELLRPALARTKNCSTESVSRVAIHIWLDSLPDAPLPEPINSDHSVGLFLATNTHLTPAAIAHARTYTQLLTGSTWSTEILQSQGLHPIQIPLQGIDPTLFYPGSKANLFGDRFVLFAGGELTYVTGADLVISAFKAFQSRHPEALLVTAWYQTGAAPADNHLLQHSEWMGRWVDEWMGAIAPENSHLLHLPDKTQNKQGQVSRWLAKELPPDSFIDLGAVPYPQLGQILREVDAALFPSRCEVGMNPIAIASLACGVPTLLSANTGHLDLIRHNLGYPLRSQRTIVPPTSMGATTGWGESDFEEIVETLEWIYTNPQEAAYRGTAAADFVQAWTWEKQIQALMDAITKSNFKMAKN